MYLKMNMWKRLYPKLKYINQVRYAFIGWFGKHYYALYFHIHGFPWQADWKMHHRPILHSRTGSSIQIGKRLELVNNPVANPVGLIQPVVISVFDGAVLIIGDDVGISGSSITVANRVEIGSNVLIGSGVLIVDNDMHPISPENRRYNLNDIQAAPIYIGDNVFVGARSIILKGVVIGEGSIVGAGSVVTTDIPPNCIAAGNPAKIVKNIEVT